MTTNQDANEETEDFTNHEEAWTPQSGEYPCVKCGNSCGGTDDLYCLRLRDLSKIKGDYIKPEDLPGFAYCWDCIDPDNKLKFEKDYFTLEVSLAKCKADNERKMNQGRPRSQATVASDDESEEVVTCFSCERFASKETKMPRHEAQAPGWLGCNLLKMIRAEDITDLYDRRLYVGSKELLEKGKDGFNTCPTCMDHLLQFLRKKARELGVPEWKIGQKIQAWPIMDMIRGVRRKEEER